ncbi:MAG: HlyD family efflux transporter periplasmic adaptor subunit [Limimaricola sp.]|uniref:HlyD family secretion protein n=1 Tax=Limimaricola sp. TaxID=2211665 RepID=UPI001D753EA2|nr:HlyD family secretion protein [Limimaricola sp.]MBI1418954.1 HlyD family efflux transporter periplasmic adaptor subunit [Limimaricola sp.]
MNTVTSLKTDAKTATPDAAEAKAPAPEAEKAAAPAPAPAPHAATPRKGRGRRSILMLLVPAAMIAGGGFYWLNSGRYETTENANLHQALLSVAPDVSGRVVAVNVSDDHPVKAGDVLFQVDPAPYKIALAQADAALASARLGVAQMRAAYVVAQAQEKVAEDQAAYYKSELARQQALADKGVATATAVQDAQHAAQVASEQLVTAQANANSALAALGGNADIKTDDHPSVLAALSARDKAQYNLDLATVTAPADGVVYQAASFRKGQFVVAGSDVFTLVETGDSWVDANFKETQLGHVSVGQPAEVSFDIYPGQVFHGHVAAIGAGTGAEFSLLPAQNATGNWVKVTQRIPVRIVLDDVPAGTAMRSGMSAKVSVDTGRIRHLSDLLPAAFTKG